MNDPGLFEEEVLRIARNRWPSAEYSGSVMHGNRERDGRFETEDMIHLVECTTSRKKEKAEKDIGKLWSQYNDEKRREREKAIKCWFVTSNEPTAEQRECVKLVKNAPDGLFNIVSFKQFQSKLIDASDYLAARKSHKFGSIYDPRTESFNGEIKYIEIELKCEGEELARSIDNLSNSIISGLNFCFLGEYGAGKSMTLREIYRASERSYFRGNTSKFPVYINLREHQGQKNPAEMLERHAREVGFQAPHQLVRAWRAGYVVLFLDGFDEVSSVGLQGAWRKLQDARKASMAGVRQLIRDTPKECGIAIAGRQHFFDTESERKDALGIVGDRWKDVHLNEFNEFQIRELVTQFGYSGEIPPWVPARPLLLSSLFARGLKVDQTNRLSVLHEPARGWDYLIDVVCDREARIESGVSGENVREIIEALATNSRKKENGLGPITPDEIIEVFKRVCGFSPADESLIVVQRLPGLGRAIDETGEARAFVDYEFCDVCAAGDIVRFVLSPFSEGICHRLMDVKHPLGVLGVEMVVSKLEATESVEGQILAAERAISREQVKAKGALIADVVSVKLKLNLGIRSEVQVNNVHIQLLDLDYDRGGYKHIRYVDCIFKSISISENFRDESFPFFKECLIQEIEGRVSAADLPQANFEDCYIDQFVSSSGTTKSVLDLNLPIAAKVLVIILRKLFVQSLGGRKNNSLYRGMDNEHQGKVAAVMSILLRNNIVTQSGRSGDGIWIPVRRNSSRVLAIISAPMSSRDSLMLEARKVR